MKRVVVFGATGFTGKLVVRALLDLGVSDPILGGRNQKKLDELAATHGGLETRVADIDKPDTLEALVSGTHVVVDTAGPFQLYGEPVVRAALAAGAHFLDTTGEQAYMSRIAERYHGAAKNKNLCVVNAQAFEFALGYVAAARMCELHPDVHTIDVFNRVSGMGATRGTQKSALGAIVEEALIRKGGRLVRRGLSPVPLRVRFPGSEKLEIAVPFPGGEALHLARIHPQVKNVTTNLVLPSSMAMPMMGVWSVRPLLRGLAKVGALEPVKRRIDSMPEGPTEEQRSSQDFKVLARGKTDRATYGVLLTGCDPYGITGVIAALGAKFLCQAPPRATGVVSTDQAFGASEFLDALAPHGVGISEHTFD
jgi:short subunit dehydrogenase-like uncharacterized protein